MTLVSLERIGRQFGDHVVLDGASLRVDEGERLGVVGDNGAGKTTLVRILAGADEPDRGERNCRRGLRVAFGSQLPRFAPETTVWQYVQRGDGSHEELEDRVRRVEAALAARPEDHNLLEEYGRLQAAFEAGGGYRRDNLCETVLQGLGFGEAERRRELRTLSGGEQSRVMLAALMTTPADLLVLDEPTNHLDLQGIEFVEGFVQRYPGAVVAVSHDRRFLDRIAKAIVEVEGGVATRYPGNWSDYVRQRDQSILSARRAYKNQRDFIAKEMEYIRRNIAGQNSAQARGRLKRLRRLQVLERPRQGKRRMRVRFDGGKGLQGQTVLEAEGLVLKLPDGRTLLEGVDLRLQFGETLAILGRNGAGKTSLLQVLAGLAEPAGGSLARSHHQRLAFFRQDAADLPEEGTVLDALRQVEPQCEERELRDHLALFLFIGDDVDKPVASLSGGERQRLNLARLTRTPCDLLCLDEPTNHLDITSAECLEEALLAFPGTVLLISHDRHFVERVADRVLYLAGGRARLFEGGLQQCLEFIAGQAQKKRAESRSDKPERTEPRAPSDPARIRNPLLFQRLEDKIIALEEELETIRTRMTEPDNYQDHQRMRELQEKEKDLQQELAAAYERWENWS